MNQTPSKPALARSHSAIKWQ